METTKLKWQAHKSPVTGNPYIVMEEGHEPYSDGLQFEVCVSWHPKAAEVSRLIAAAPELLELLGQAVPWISHALPETHLGPCTPETPCDMNCVDLAAGSQLLYEIKQAIAKATGES